MTYSIFILFFSFLVCFAGTNTHKTGLEELFKKNSIHNSREQRKIPNHQNLDDLDSTFIQSLKKRVVLGVDISGGPTQQIYHLKKLKILKCCYVWAGTEGQIIKESNNNARLFEGIGFVRNPLKAKMSAPKKIKGWISATPGYAHSVYDILKNSYTYRGNLGVVCTLSELDSVIYRGGEYSVKLSFQNTSNEDKTLEIYTSTPIFRDISNAHPMNSLKAIGNIKSQRIKIGQNQSNSLTVDLTNVIASFKRTGHFYLYFKYRTSRSIGFGVSDFIEIKLKDKITLPNKK